MKLPRFAVAGLAALALCAAPSRADLTWEHSGQVRFTGLKAPVMKFKLFTNLTPTRHRMMLKYDINPEAMGGAMGGMNAVPGAEAFGAPLLKPAFMLAQIGGPSADAMPNFLQGSFALVQRFDDGKLIAYSSLSDKCIDEPIQDLLTKSRFDPWKTIAPKLSQNAPPALTGEQRQRLGAEVRAALAPYTGNMWRTFFRELPDKRTFNGIEGHGYRLTMLFNADNPFSGSGKWARVATEWWVAGDQPGDADMISLREAAVKLVGTDYKSSTSMWLNETPRVLWEMLPDELHQAVYTLMPPPDAKPEDAAFKKVNTPLAMYLTVTPPPGMGDKLGELRAEMNLVRHSTETLPASVFEVPANYKRVPFDDIMKQIDKAAEGAKASLPSMPGK